MRFALVNNKLQEAAPGAKGLCPGCRQTVVAKCGIQKVHHWAHKGARTCDNWWEPETEWHRRWKNNFPVEWQEIFLPDGRTGEKHIADVRTPHGLVIEFQHSHIQPEERISREKFYNNLVWVVDGRRLKRDYQRFLRNREHFHLGTDGIYKVDDFLECFHPSWVGSSVPVIFDFGSENPIRTNNTTLNLFCLLPIQIGLYSFVAEVSRNAFIKSTLSGEWSPRLDNFLSKLFQEKKEWEAQLENQMRLQDSLNFELFSRAMRYKRGRRL